MKPSRTWASPSPRSVVHSTSAWSWLLHWWNGPLRTTCAPNAGWQSRLLSFLEISRKRPDEQPNLVISISNWGALVWPLTRIDDTTFTLELVNQPIRWLHVHNVGEFEIVPYRVAQAGTRIEFHVTGLWAPMLEAALVQGVVVTRPEANMLLNTIGKSAILDREASLEDCVLTFARVVFAHLDEIEIEKIIAQCLAGFKKKQAAPPISEDLADILEEVAMHDVDNMQDLSELKQQLKGHRLATLDRLRKQVKQVKVSRMAKRQANKNRAKAKAKSKGKGRDPAKQPAPATQAAPLAALPAPAPDESEAPPAQAAIVPFDPSSSQPAEPRQKRNLPRGRMYSTPAVVADLKPPDCSVSLDVPQCRWKGITAQGASVSAGFGPNSVWGGRRVALEAILDELWSTSDHRREQRHYVAAVPASSFEGCLDVTDDKPRKYAKA